MDKKPPRNKNKYARINSEHVPNYTRHTHIGVFTNGTLYQF